MDYINTETKAVVSSTDLRALISCSFPDGAELPGYAPITPADAPDAAPGYRVIASDPVVVGGQWQYGWAQVELTAAEIAAQTAAHNAPILAALQEIDLRTIRPLREGDSARVAMLDAEASALRLKLIM